MLFSKCLRQAFLSLAFFLLVTSSVTAGTLFGTVSEIHDGDTITIICLKRPLQIHLMGIMAPEKEQPYSEVARQHLSDLILNSQVVVETSGLGENALIVGRVFLKEADVGAQMLRDGAAWYDKPYDSILTEDQRQMYLACESAARSEHRGIWQDANPLPPWEFKEGMRLPAPSKSSPVVNTKAAAQTRRSGLTSESLSPSFASTGPLSLGSSEPVAVSSDSRWVRYTQPDSKASILVPGDGSKRTTQVLMGDGRVVKVNTYQGRADRTAYVVVSSTGPSAGESDADIMDNAIKGFIGGIQNDFKKLGATFECYPNLDREILVSGYAG
ncbi:MAG: thermonuclease family protein, partial [Pyrinomonadaceae bacterium]|nr:thermonuclease family protein [Pyrinomonadaceae bacterium]